MGRRSALLAALAGVLGIAAALFVAPFYAGGRSSRAEVLRVGVLPSAAESQLHLRYSSLLAHLSQKTGRPTQLVTTSSYEELLNLFEEHRVDLGFFGGLTFIRAHAFFGAEPLVMRDGDKRASTYAVVKEGGPFQDCYNFDCAGLARARLLFGPRLSTSGHLMPRHFLKAERNMEPEASFGAVGYGEGHRAVVLAVRDGAADVAMVNAGMFRAMLGDGVVKPGELHVIWETPPFPDSVWAVQADMDEVLKTRLRDAFLALDASDDADASPTESDLINSYMPAATADFASLLKIADAQGLMKRGSP